MVLSPYGTDLEVGTVELLGDLARMAGEMVSHEGHQLSLSTRP